MAEKKPKIGLLLTTSTESENTRTIIKLAEAALDEGMEVSVFLMCDGIYNINAEAFNALAERGAELCLCAYNAEQRKVEKKEPVLFGSQYDLANMVAEADRFLAFN